MSELIITPNFDKKTAKFRGVVAGGEHVSVVLKDCAEIETEGLRVRVLDGRKMVAIFPHLETDEFAVSENDLTFTLNLNTSELLDSLSRLCEKEFFFIIDNPSDGVRRLYADGFHSIKKWKMIEGSDTPVSLDDYQTTIEGFVERLDAVEEKANTSDQKAASALSATSSFQGDIESLGERVSANEQDISENQSSIGLLDAKAGQHIGDKNNPHQVTAKQLGLDNVDNTADADKPVSTAQQSAINEAKQQAVSAAQTAVSELGQEFTASLNKETTDRAAADTDLAQGIATEENRAKAAEQSLRDLFTNFKHFVKYESLAKLEEDIASLSTQVIYLVPAENPDADKKNILDGYVVLLDDNGNRFLENMGSSDVDLSGYVKSVNGIAPDSDGNVNTPTPPITSVNGKTGAVELTASDVGAADAFGVGDGIELKDNFEMWYRWDLPHEMSSEPGGPVVWTKTRPNNVDELYGFKTDTYFSRDGEPNSEAEFHIDVNNSDGRAAIYLGDPNGSYRPYYIGEYLPKANILGYSSEDPVILTPILSLSPAVKQQIADNTAAIAIKVGMGAEYAKTATVPYEEGQFTVGSANRNSVIVFGSTSQNSIGFEPFIVNGEIVTFELTFDCSAAAPTDLSFHYNGSSTDIKWADGTPSFEVGNIYLLAFRWMPINGGTWLANVQMSWEA